MAVTSKRDKYDRMLDQALHNPTERNEWLAKLPVEPDPFYAPIKLNATTGDVSVSMLPVVPNLGDYLNQGEDEIATVLNRYPGKDRGPVVLVALLLEYPDGSIRTAVIQGTFGAVCQAFPDSDTLKAWRADGVTEVWSWEIDEPTVNEASIWREGMSHLDFLQAKKKALTEASRKLIPIDQMPKVLQRELLSRTLAAETV